MSDQQWLDGAETTYLNEQGAARELRERFRTTAAERFRQEREQRIKDLFGDVPDDWRYEAQTLDFSLFSSLPADYFKEMEAEECFTWLKNKVGEYPGASAVMTINPQAVAGRVSSVHKIEGKRESFLIWMWK